MCTARMLAIKRGMLDLAKLARKFNCSQGLIEDLPSCSMLTKVVTACADSLCMGLPYLSKPEHGKFGKIATASPLIVARDWYRLLRDEIGCELAVRKLGWCADAATVLQKNGTRVFA